MPQAQLIAFEISAGSFVLQVESTDGRFFARVAPRKPEHKAWKRALPLLKKAKATEEGIVLNTQDFVIAETLLRALLEPLKLLLRPSSYLYQKGSATFIVTEDTRSEATAYLYRVDRKLSKHNPDDRALYEAAQQLFEASWHGKDAIALSLSPEQALLRARRLATYQEIVNLA